MTISPSLTVDTLAGSGAADGVVIRSDLLPPNTHGSNLRGIFKNTKIWDALRIPVCARAQNLCEICGTETMRSGKPGRPDCHEKWVFELQGPHPVQRLARLIALCPACHEVQHCGLARVRGRQDHVIAHLCRLNHWTPEQARADLQRSSDRCWQLEQTQWHLDLQVLHGQIEIPGFPTLQIPADRRHELGNSMQ